MLHRSLTSIVTRTRNAEALIEKSNVHRDCCQGAAVAPGVAIPRTQRSASGYDVCCGEIPSLQLECHLVPKTRVLQRRAAHVGAALGQHVAVVLQVLQLLEEGRVEGVQLGAQILVFGLDRQQPRPAQGSGQG